MSVSLGTGRDGRSALADWWGALLTLRRERWGDVTGYLFIAPSFPFLRAEIEKLIKRLGIPAL